jgi:hypothetical protein
MNPVVSIDQKQPSAMRSSAWSRHVLSMGTEVSGVGVESEDADESLELLVTAEIAPTASAPTTTAPQKSDDSVDELTVVRCSG